MRFVLLIIFLFKLMINPLLSVKVNILVESQKRRKKNKINS